MGKAVQEFIKALKQTNQDEKFVEKDKSSLSFINIWIRQSELEGRIGRVEADVEEDLPQTANQLKDVAMQLLGMNNEFIDEAMYHPQNSPFLAKVLGAPEFFIPNSDSRDKQYAEFAELAQGIPVLVDEEVDNHPIEAEVCKTFLISQSGRGIAPEAREAIKAHMIEHQEAEKRKMMKEMLEAEQMKQQQQPATPAAEGAPS